MKVLGRSLASPFALLRSLHLILSARGRLAQCCSASHPGHPSLQLLSFPTRVMLAKHPEYKAPHLPRATQPQAAEMVWPWMSLSCCANSHKALSHQKSVLHHYRGCPHEPHCFSSPPAHTPAQFRQCFPLPNKLSLFSGTSPPQQPNPLQTDVPSPKSLSQTFSLSASISGACSGLTSAAKISPSTSVPCICLFHGP